ncbi:MAG: hypothetical protein AB1649_06010 [Chloroflexota bacterium]
MKQSHWLSFTKLLIVTCCKRRSPTHLSTVKCHKITISICTIFLVLLVAGTALGKTFWEAYLSLPTPQNASVVTKIEYTPGAIPKEYGYWKPDLDILRNQILGGDSEAFRLAYRLLQKADGGLAEDLTVILSNTIRARPEFFLKELSALRPSTGSLEDILLMSGTEYTDRPEAEQYEMKMRIKALESIETKILKHFRDRCLEIMRKK